jgi:argininosuccinate lyase
MLATDLADYLVRKGVPFRETHHIAGAAVRLAEERQIALSALSLADLQALHPAFEEDVMNVWDPGVSVEKRNVVGGTSLNSVQAQIDRLRRWLDE